MALELLGQAQLENRAEEQEPSSCRYHCQPATDTYLPAWVGFILVKICHSAKEFLGSKRFILVSGAPLATTGFSEARTPQQELRSRSTATYRLATVSTNVFFDLLPAVYKCFVNQVLVV